MDATEFIKTFIILVAVIDPIGNIPVYIALTSHKTDAEHKSIALKTSCSAVLLLVVSFLFGKYIITFFGIKMSALNSLVEYSLSTFHSPCCRMKRISILL